MLPLLRKALPFLLVGIVIAAAYDGWVFYSRWLKILNFYASPGSIRRGEKANVCYGVFGAKSVRIDPPVEELHPAVAHCLQVSPAKTTEYKLVAEDGAGHSAIQAFVLQVAP
jgi:hypothetical protein